MKALDTLHREELRKKSAELREQAKLNSSDKKVHNQVSAHILYNFNMRLFLTHIFACKSCSMFSYGILDLQILIDKDKIIFELRSELSSTVTVVEDNAATKLISLRTELTGEVTAAKAKAEEAEAKMKATVRAERHVTASRLAAIQKQHQGQLKTITAKAAKARAKDEAALLVEKNRVSVLAQQHDDEQRSAATTISGLRQSISDIKVKVKSDQRESRKERSAATIAQVKVIKERNKLAQTMVSNELKMKRAVASAVTVSSKRQKSLSTSLQIELDAARLSVGALTKDIEALTIENANLQYECASGIEEIQVSYCALLLYSNSNTNYSLQVLLPF